MISESFLIKAQVFTWAAIILVGAVLLLYLIRNRLKEKKKETFEKRAN